MNEIKTVSDLTPEELEELGRQAIVHGLCTAGALGMLITSLGPVSGSTQAFSGAGLSLMAYTLATGFLRGGLTRFSRSWPWQMTAAVTIAAYLAWSYGGVLWA
jgi:hypothetical protein